jgi:hypothetical protein
MEPKAWRKIKQPWPNENCLLMSHPVSNLNTNYFSCSLTDSFVSFVRFKDSWFCPAFTIYREGCKVLDPKSLHVELFGEQIMHLLSSGASSSLSLTISCKLKMGS